MLESQTLSASVSQHPRFVFINYKQVYRKMNHFFVSVVYYNFFTKVKSEPCSRLNGYCVEEQRRIQNSSKHLHSEFSSVLLHNSSLNGYMALILEKIVKMVKDINYFCDKLHLRCLIGLEYTSEEYLFWKYPEN